MARHYFKRKTNNIARSRVALFGPLDNENRPPSGPPQRLLFNLARGTIARCQLKSGRRYIAYVEMFGERGGSFEGSIQPTDQSKPFHKVFAVAIPPNWSGPRGVLGYSYPTAAIFDVPGDQS